MADTRVMTAPIAMIKVGAQVIGLMKSLRVSESVQRGNVSGIGALLKSEVPALSWSGTVSCSFYMINLSSTGIPKAMIRDVPTVQSWIDNILLSEQKVDIAIFKKIPANFDPATCLTDGTLTPFAVIRGCFINSDGFDINEGQISGRDQQFEYLQPILFKNEVGG
jgi:hypothetical protein